MSTVHPDGSTKRALKVSIAPDGTVAAETIGFTGDACLSQIGVLEATTVRSAFTDEYVTTRTETRSDARLTTQEGATGGAR